MRDTRDVPGFLAPVRQALTQPLLMGGAPRSYAILNGTHPVKAWREHGDLTQDALAAKAGISTAYLCQIETGKRQGAVKTLKALAKALGVSLDDLQG